MKVTLKQLEAVLKSMPNSIGTYAQIIQITEPRILKKDRETKEECKFKKVEKVKNWNVLLNTEYKAAAKRADKDYKTGINTMPIELCENNSFFGYYKGEPIIQYRPHKRSYPKVEFYADGKPVKEKELKGILPVEREQKPIQWRKVYLKNIKEIHINSNVYILTKG